MNIFLCIFPLNDILYIFMCTYAFYFCPWLYLSATYLCVSPYEANKGIVSLRLSQLFIHLSAFVQFDLSPSLKNLIVAKSTLCFLWLV